ncbi:MAG: serine hydrolase [Pseudomonadota bacterium]
MRGRTLGRRSAGRLLLWMLLGIALVALGYTGARWAPIVNAGSGYAAKNICSGHFLSGFDPQLVVDQALIGASPLLGRVSYEVDTDAQQVRTRLFGLFPRVAQYSPMLGCTLLPSGSNAAAPQIEAVQAPERTTADEWPIASLTPVVREELDALLAAAFEETDPARPRNTKAVAIVHRGQLIAERYADGVGPETPLLGWSMTKSVTGLLVSLLVKDGLLDVSEPAPVPEWQDEASDPRARITLDQLLRMSSGLAFNETYGPGSDVTQMLSGESDMGAFAARMPLTSAEGTTWAYSSGTSNIVAGIVRRAAGGTAQDAYAFAQRRLFQPLGIRTAVMEVDASGTFVGSSYMYASARDWARLGWLCLADGRWQNEQLLPPAWLSYLTTPAPANPANNYGAHFWLNQDPTDPVTARVFPSLPTDAYAMDGYQGQAVIMVPSAELVVVRLGFTPRGNDGIEALVAGVIRVLGAASIASAD